MVLYMHMYWNISDIEAEKYILINLDM